MYRSRKCPGLQYLITVLESCALSAWHQKQLTTNLCDNTLCKSGSQDTTTLAKKRTIIEIRGEKNAVPRVISCSIRRDQRRAKVADSRGSDLPCADRAWSSMISHVHVEQRSSRRESRWWFFFLARVVVHQQMWMFPNSPIEKNRPSQSMSWSTY